jgi:hypothetical protein
VKPWNTLWASFRAEDLASTVDKLLTRAVRNEVWIATGDRTVAADNVARVALDIYHSHRVSLSVLMRFVIGHRDLKTAAEFLESLETFERGLRVSYDAQLDIARREGMLEAAQQVCLN